MSILLGFAEAEENEYHPPLNVLHAFQLDNFDIIVSIITHPEMHQSHTKERLSSFGLVVCCVPNNVAAMTMNIHGQEEHSKHHASHSYLRPAAIR